MENDNLTKNVMKEISEGRITMRPKSYFVFGSLLLILGIILFAIAAAFLLNITMYRFIDAAPFEYLLFGGRGFMAFLGTFPWIPLAAGIIITIIGIIFLKRFDISYKKSIAAIITGFIFVIVAGAFFINISGINSPLRCRLGVLYEKRSAGYTWVDGTITDIGFFTLTVDTGNTVQTVGWHKSTEFPHGNEFEIGMRIRALGYPIGDVFEATGIAIKGAGRKGSGGIFEPGGGRGKCPVN